jgi:rhodanese-related sulfurtransferase
MTTQTPIVISADALADILSTRTPDAFWNVLTDDYFTGELIPGSRRVPVDRVGREVVETHLDRGAAIVVYCSGPTCPQSRAVAEKLLALGYRDVRLFEGGLEAWKASARAVERTVIDGPFTETEEIATVKF